MYHIIVGAGISGMSAVRYLHDKHDKHRDAQIVLFDDNRAHLPRSFNLQRVTFTDSLAWVFNLLTSEKTQQVVLSPAIPLSHPLVVAAERRGIEVVSEVAVGLASYRGKIVAVTGTNGKSTVCAMLNHILGAVSVRSAVAGNIGVPITTLMREETHPDVMVLELSSYQLEHLSEIRPHIGIITNIAEDHLARHRSAREYFRVKTKVLNATALKITDCSVYAQFADDTVQVVDCSATPPIAKNFWQIREAALFHKNQRVCDLSSAQLTATHDYQNAAMALVAAHHLTLRPFTSLAAHLASYRGLPHRLQHIGYLAGQVVINDAKSTNVAATVTALEAQSQPVLLLLGGRAKGESFAPLRACREKIAAIAVFGKDRHTITAQLSDHFSCTTYPSLAALVSALNRFPPRDPILFSPACATDDEFADFSARGDFFCKNLKKLCTE